MEYTRQVFFVKNEFWIVKDNFQSTSVHNYKQVWQGHYTDENDSNLLRAVAPDATGHDILQLHKTDATFSDGARGKQWSVVSKSNQKDFSFLTIIYPFKNINNRLDETAKEVMINDWAVNQSEWKMKGSDATSLSSDKGTFIFNVKKLKGQDWIIKSEEETDLFITRENNQLFIHSINIHNNTITFISKDKNKETTKVLKPGEAWVLSL